MKKKIYTLIELLHKNNIFYIFYILALCFFIWGIPGKGILYFGDVQASYIFHPEKVYGSLNIWQDLYNSGTLNYGIFQNYLFSFFVILSSFIFKLYWHSYIYSFFGFFLFSLSAFYLYKRIFNNKFVAFIIAIFFLVSPMAHVYHSGILLIYSLSFINFSLLFFLKIFNSNDKRKIKWKEVIAISIFLTLANVYIQSFFLVFYIFPIFVLVNAKELYKNVRYFLKNFVCIGIFYIFLNFSWIFILFYQFLFTKNNFINAALQTTSSMDVANLITKLTKFIDFFRVIPYAVGALELYNTNKFLLILSFIISILSFSGLLFYKNKKYTKGIIFSLILIVIIFPILNGNKGIFSDFFLFIWNHVPFFKTFRTFTKLMFIILYVISYLFGISVIFLQDKLRNTKKLIYVNFILVFVITFPIIVYNHGLIRKRSLIQDVVPIDYEKLRVNVDESLEAETMIMPQTNWLVTYKWRAKEKDAENIIPFFYSGRVFTNGAQYEHVQEWQHYNNLATSLLINRYFDQLGYLFSYKNVNYILLQDDISSFLDFNDGTRIDIESNLKGGTAFFKKIAQFGDLYVFEIPEKFFNQQIYSPKNIYLIQRDDSKYDLIRYSPYIISKILNDNIKDADSTIIFEEQNRAQRFDYPILNEKNFLFSYNYSAILDYASPADSPKILAVSKDKRNSKSDAKYEKIDLTQFKFNSANVEFKRTSPEQYEVYIHNVASGDVPILFNETFDSGWNLYPSNINNIKKYRPKTVNSQIESQNIKQASPADIENYKKNNAISTINYDFISKSYNRSIQNNNLASTPLSAIFLKKKIDNQEHIYANGYSNLYIIEPEEICRQYQASCIKNNDGSYDIRLVIFLTPQKYFYLAFLISILSLLFFISYLIYRYWNNRKLIKNQLTH